MLLWKEELWENSFKSGMLCPMPVIALDGHKKRGPAMSSRLFDDLAFEPDITAWCNETGKELNGT
jgi:TusA-related sulfurtransferase